MAKYRNRPDRRARRDVQQNICAVLSYTAAFTAANTVQMTFTGNVVLDGTPNLLLITPAGGVAAALETATLTGPQTITLVFDAEVDGANKFLFVRDGDIAIRAQTGGYVSHEPRLILAS
jgi:hypothetical protein